MQGKISLTTTVFYVVLPWLAFVGLMVITFLYGRTITALVLIYGFSIPVGIVIYFLVRFARNAAQKFFQKWGASAFTKEYLARETFLVISGYLFSVSLIIRPIMELVSGESVLPITSSEIFSSVLLTGGFTALYLTMIIGIRVLVLRSDFDFRYYRTLGYLNRCLEEENDAAKSRFFGLALNDYNAFIHRKIRLQIDNIGRLGLKFRLMDSTYRNEIVKKFIEALNMDDPPERRGLRPILIISRELGSLNHDEILTSDKTFVNTTYVILTIVIPILIALGSLILQALQNKGG